MNKNNLKIFHLVLSVYPYRVEYLEELLPWMARQGYNAVLLEYRNAFPFDCPDISSSHAYSREDIGRIEKVASACGLATLPKGLSFTHSDNILRHQRYKHLADSVSDLDLTHPESLSLMVESGMELLAAHPRSRIIHFGGDEMAEMGKTPAALRAVLEMGRSGLYVSFVNKLAKVFAVKGARVAIWSDMLIRYPQAIDDLDKRVMIFYWDYWSHGERTPFVSIGGGCPDLFVLDRKALTGSLKKMFVIPAVREAEELPAGHLERFGSYWRLDPQKRSADSFPYLKWFKEKGLSVVAACLPYPEKGSFLPNFREKLDHLRWFSKRLRAAEGDGFMACLWQPHWPHLETSRLGFLSALELMEDPDREDPEIFQNISQRLGGIWTASSVESFMDLGEGFEYADTLNPLWAGNDIPQSLSWLEKAGMLADDLRMAKACLEKIRTLLGGEWRDLSSKVFERFALEDMAWRAECELAVHSGDRRRMASLKDEGGRLQTHFRDAANAWHKRDVVDTLSAARYELWLQSLSV